MYLRKTDGSPPVRLGEGSALGISPDGLWAMTSNMATPPQIVLLPTGAGEPRQVTHDAIQHLDACWLPDSKHIVFEGVESGHKARVYFQAMEGEGPRPITAEGLSGSLRCLLAARHAGVRQKPAADLVGAGRWWLATEGARNRARRRHRRLDHRWPGNARDSHLRDTRESEQSSETFL